MLTPCIKFLRHRINLRFLIIIDFNFSLMKEWLLSKEVESKDYLKGLFLKLKTFTASQVEKYKAKETWKRSTTNEKKSQFSFLLNELNHHITSSHVYVYPCMHMEISPFPEESLFGAVDSWGWRNLYRAIPAVSRSICLIRRTARL